MKFEYLKWDESLAAALQNFSNLMNLFNFLLLQASGDVDKVLEWMKIPAAPRLHRRALRPGGVPRATGAPGDHPA